MINTPGLAEIHAAELRVSESWQDTRIAIEQVQAASRKSVSRISVLAAVAGVIVVATIWLSGRSRSTISGRTARTTSVISLVFAAILRYGRLALPFIRKIRISPVVHHTVLPEPYTTSYIQGGPDQRV